MKLNKQPSLDPFFHPTGVALIGASRDPSKLSYGILKNLTDPHYGFRGPIYPVNPKSPEILGMPCYPDILSVPDPVDLAVLILPAELTGPALEDCGKRGLRAAIIISGGFREAGPEGARREQELLEIASRYGLRLMGPNCIGVIDTHTPLNTTFVSGMPPAGDIAFFSQSGALCGGVIDWIVGQGIGFSKLLSVGNEVDVNESDLIPVLAEDQNTRVITLYLEDVKGGPRFVETLRQAASRKPVLAIKAGRTHSGQTATASHTGALASPYTAFQAACQHAGAIVVEDIEGLFHAALALSYQPVLQGNRIAIVTAAGGPAALAADTMETYGLRLARTSPAVQEAIRPSLAPSAVLSGPVDMLGGADFKEYRLVAEALLKDPEADGLLAILVPHRLNSPVAVVEALAEASQAARVNKPVVACFMGEASLEGVFAAAHRFRLPAFRFPEDAVRVLGVLYRRGEWLAMRITQPSGIPATPPYMAQAILRQARANRRSVLDPVECRRVLEGYGISMPEDKVATSPVQAARYAQELGYPVVMKLASPDALHKSDLGGVIIGITDEIAARRAYKNILSDALAASLNLRIEGIQVQKMITGGIEVIVGIKRDETYGPLVMFGLGGIYAEALADVSFRLAPLNEAEAADMIDEVRSAKILTGLRGHLPADRQALIETLLRVSRLAVENPEILEMDLNPLIVLPEGQGALAVDARILLC